MDLNAADISCYAPHFLDGRFVFAYGKFPQAVVDIKVFASLTLFSAPPPILLRKIAPSRWEGLSRLRRIAFAPQMHPPRQASPAPLPMGGGHFSNKKRRPLYRSRRNRCYYSTASVSGAVSSTNSEPSSISLKEISNSL